jgi:hypothetical protein
MSQLHKEKSSVIDDEINLKDLIFKLKDLWVYMCTQWLIIMLISGVGGLLGLGYAWVKKTAYNAELSFALEDTQSGGGLGAAVGLASQFGIDLGGGSVGGAFSGDNLMALMKSRSMIERTLLTPVVINNKKQTLAESYIAFNQLRRGWQESLKLKSISFAPNMPRAEFSLAQDSVLGTFYKSIIKNNLIVDKLDKKSSIVTVKVTSQDELFSKLFTEILVKNVSDFYILTKTKKSADNVNVLQRQTDSVRKALNSAINGVAQSSDVNPNPNPALQILRVPSQRRQVDVQADQAILTQLVTNLELSKLSLRKETPLIQVIDKPILPLDRVKLKKSTGMVLGAIIGAFLSILILSLLRILKNLTT